MKFHTTIELGGKTATGLRVPPDIITALTAMKRAPVTITINNHTYRTTVAPYNGAFMVPLSAEHRTAAGVQAGDEVEVDIELDTAPREVEIPADLAAALDATPGARAAFDKLSYTHRKEHVRAIEEAKAEATRQRRITKCIEKLTQ
ncbi:YdeI/OmpD-associated family protein [Actinokineospora enzanensis]|uniref:YdeI/OmpD-associated family protein n=1 Tax=Actinokineospora enzanensis TaxID=155975 RepID=UPI00037E872E|nr:YdeI/OmpD-associated family protein [Actinokineospora enzanensis]